MRDHVRQDARIGRRQAALEPSLYTATLPQIAALAVVDVAQVPHPARVALRCLVAVGVFAAMSAWIRANRPAFDLQNWCDCAGERMMIRVIDSRRLEPHLPRELPIITLDPAEEEYEIAAREAISGRRGPG